MVISTNREKTLVTAAIIDEERRRLLRGLDTMHDLRPDIDQLAGIGVGAQFSHVFVQGDVVIFERELLGAK